MAELQTEVLSFKHPGGQRQKFPFCSLFYAIRQNNQRLYMLLVSSFIA